MARHARGMPCWKARNAAGSATCRKRESAFFRYFLPAPRLREPPPRCYSIIRPSSAGSRSRRFAEREHHRGLRRSIRGFGERSYSRQGGGHPPRPRLAPRRWNRAPDPTKVPLLREACARREPARLVQPAAGALEWTARTRRPTIGTAGRVAKGGTVPGRHGGSSGGGPCREVGRGGGVPRAPREGARRVGSDPSPQARGSPGGSRDDGLRTGSTRTGRAAPADRGSRTGGRMCCASASNTTFGIPLARSGRDEPPEVGGTAGAPAAP